MTELFKLYSLKYKTNIVVNYCYSLDGFPKVHVFKI